MPTPVAAACSLAVDLLKVDRHAARLGLVLPGAHARQLQHAARRAHHLGRMVSVGDVDHLADARLDDELGAPVISAISNQCDQCNQ